MREISSSLSSLEVALSSNGAVDWDKFARSMNYPLIPGECKERESYLARLEAAILEAALYVLPDPEQSRRQQLILRRRFLDAGSAQNTLEEIAELYGLTRERVRQIEARAISVIREGLLCGCYLGCSFRFREEICEPLRSADNLLRSSGRKAWHQESWKATLSDCLNVSVQDLERYWRLLNALLSTRDVVLDPQSLGTIVVTDDAPSVAHLTVRIKAVHESLESEPAGLDLVDLAVAANRRLSKSNRLKLTELPEILSLCRSVEECSIDFYRLRFRFLKSRGDQCVRVLATQGEPMHFRDIAREINKQASVDERASVRTLTNQMTNDIRLIPIGRTGLWALSQWGKETRTIAEIMRDELANHGEPLNESELYTRVIGLRPVSPNSIPMLLADASSVFQKVGIRRWGLTEWSGNRGGDDDVGTFVDQFFVSRASGEVPFVELRVGLQNALQLSPRAASGVLGSHPSVRVETRAPKCRFAVYKPGWRMAADVRQEGGQRVRVRPNLMDQIASAVRLKLMESNNGERNMIELVREIETEMKAIRPTIYAAISQSKDVESVAVDSSTLKIVRLTNAVPARFLHVDKISRAAWRAEVSRALSHLNLAGVDISLFLMGRLFDVAMRELIRVARLTGQVPVQDGNDKNLNSRIDWAIKHSLVEDRGNMHLLRVERNERGHDAPSEPERRAALKYAHFIIELYLDYLVIVESKIKLLAE